MTVVYVLLIAHFVGDFVCQTDWMALNKAKSWLALTLHVTVYIVIMGAFANWALFAMHEWHRLPLAPVATWGAVNGGAHYVQDAITSRINARLWQANERHWFFVGIGADQLLHYVCLFVTAGWWLR